MDEETIKYIKEYQEFVKKEMDNIFKNPLKKEWKGDDPTTGFGKKGFFNIHNWNDARVNLFRGFFASWCHGGISNEIAFIGNLEILHDWDEDQNYVFIRNSKNNDLYYATWYKSRGRTGLIVCNGYKITLLQLKALLEEMLGEMRNTSEVI